jgi:hypothetical protein
MDTNAILSTVAIIVSVGGAIITAINAITITCIIIIYSSTNCNNSSNSKLILMSI